MKTTLSCIIAGAVMATAIPAQADVKADESNQITVRHDDLNLLSQSGMETLERRIHYAARKVCGVNAIRTGTRVPSQQALECYDQAVSAAERQVAIARQDQASQAVRVARNGN